MPLKIEIPPHEFWDSENEKFVYTKAHTITLEHSLISLSKWESKWHKPFLTDDEKWKKTNEEMLDYIRCMTIESNVDPLVYKLLTQKNIDDINNYIGDSMTATWFSNEEDQRPSREIVTSEVIYSWMAAAQLPAEYQKWHLNRLMTTLKVISKHNQPPKKMGRKGTLRQNASLNAARRAAHGLK